MRDVEHESMAGAEEPEAPQQPVEPEAAGPSSVFHSRGELPRVTDEFRPSQPTASELAFGTHDWIADARRYNRAHPSYVQQFNLATGDTCVKGDEPDPELVANWQREHGLGSDGKIGPMTAGAARTRSTSSTSAPTVTAVQYHPTQPTTGSGAGSATSWETGTWSDPSAYKDPTYTGIQAYDERKTKLTRQEIYDEITKVAPSLPHDFKLLLVGHAMVEQNGSRIINNNYAGVEGDPRSYDPSAAVVDSPGVSQVITRKQYDGNPSAYSDMSAAHIKGAYTKNYNDGRGTLDVSWIQLQLDRHDPKLCVRVKQIRPAYKNLDQATAAYVKEIERRIRKLQASPDPKLRDLAAKALAGDAHAYGDIVSHAYAGFGAYNDDGDYGKNVESSIGDARKDPAFAPKGP